MKESRVLLTGATGFIGRHVVKRLLDAGYSLRILTRNPNFLEYREHPYVETRVVNYLDMRTMRNIMEDIDYIVHMAGVIKGRTFAPFKKGNIYTTKNLLKAVGDKKIKKFIFLSSQSAAGPSFEKPLTEEDMPRPVSFYGLSKKIAEEHVMKSGIPYVILRPSAVFGEGDRETLVLFKMVKGGVSVSIGEGPLFNIIYVKDLAEIILRVMEGSKIVNKTYFVNNGEVYSPKKLNILLKEIMGKRQLFHIRIPEAVAVFFTFLSEFYSGLSGKETMLTREKLRELKQYSWLASNELLKEEVLAEFTGAREAFLNAYLWYKERGWL